MKEKYTYDFIHGTNIYLYQHKEMFRTNTDTALLTQFMKVDQGDVVLDIGTNNGALLLAAAQFQPSFLYGVEIQEEALELARYNLQHHNLTSFELILGDVCEMKLPKVDVVICNPPFFKIADNSHLNAKDALATARHEIYLPLDTLAKKIGEALDEKGRAYIVHRANRIAELMMVFQKERLQPRTLQFVYDENKEEAVSVLMEFIKHGGVNCHVLPPHIIQR